MKTFRHRTTWAMLTAGACLSVLPAHAAVIAEQFQDMSAEARVMDLAYTLVDLNPDDGITPQISFRAGLTLAGDGTGSPETYNEMSMSQASVSFVGYTSESSRLPQAQQAAFMPTDSLFVTGADGRAFAELSSAGYRSSVLMDRSYLENQMQDAYALGDAQGSLLRAADSSVSRVAVDLPVETDRTSFAVSIVPELVQAMPYFELTPNTQVIFSGQLQAVAGLQGDFIPAGNTVVYGQAIASVSVHRRLPADGQTQWAQLEDSVQAFERQSQSLLASMNRSADGQGQESLSSAFTLTFTNASEAMLEGVLNARTSASLTFVGDLATVPEPSTYALMGLGVLGVLGAARRRQP